MDEKLRALMDQTPEKPPRSKLDPHEDVIRELRRRGRTYQEIAQFFAEHLNMTVAPSTIYAFIRVRARRRQRLPIELPPANIETEQAASNRGHLGSEDDVKERIAALKRRRPPKEPQKPRFEYDENEPLRLIPRTNQEQKSGKQN